VREFQIDRGAQDEWALRSQQRFSSAQAAGKFKDEIVPLEVPGRKGPTTFAADEHNRPDTTREALAKLRPAFRDGGTITAGNAPGLNTGAAGDGPRRRGLGREARSRAGRAAGRLRHRRGRARDVRSRPDPGGQAGAGARRLDDRATSSESRSTKRSPRSSSR
jgi:acetyl-CoA acetyltransferase